MAEKQGMALVERLMGGEAEPYEQRQKLVRLANAAPDLLAACETFDQIKTAADTSGQALDGFSERAAYRRAVDVARTAIAKARGE